MNVPEILGLNKYIDLLEKTRTSFNLIGPHEDVVEHCKDCLSALDVFFEYALIIQRSLRIKSEINTTLQCLDLGTGAGLPGIVLALAFLQEYKKRGIEGYQWNLLERTQKKAYFVKNVIVELEKYNKTRLYTNVICDDLQQCKLKEKVHIVTARAFRPLSPKILIQIKHIAPEALLLFYKGTKKTLDLELEQVGSLLKVNDIVKLDHPLKKERHLLVAQFAD